MKVQTILAEIQRAKEWNQTDLARELKVTQPTVSRWYKGAKPEIDQRDRIFRLAKKLGVVGTHESAEQFIVPIVGYVGAGGQILYEEGQGPFGEAKMPPNKGNEKTVAVVVKGDSMAGQLEDGWTVYYDDMLTPPTEKLLGKLCVVGLEDGRVLVKKLLPGRAKGLYDLYSANAGPLIDQAVTWAALVLWIAPN